MKQKLKYGVSGALAGAANGLFGAGGGLFLVPLFSTWCKLPQRKAFAASVAVVLPLSVVSGFLYLQSGAVSLAAAVPFCVGGALGGWLSGRVFPRVSVVWLRRVFGVFLLYGGVRAVLAL